MIDQWCNAIHSLDLLGSDTELLQLRGELFQDPRVRGCVVSLLRRLWQSVRLQSSLLLSIISV